jgi:hypothetical protein
MCPNTIDAVYVSTILCLEHATVLAVLYFVFHFIISFYCHVTQDLHLEYIELYSWKQHAFIIRVTQIKKEFLCLISISARILMSNGLLCLYTLEKIKEATKSGHSRDTGNIGHTRYRTNTNKFSTQHRKLRI